MVSSGTVTSELSKLSSCVSDFTSCISGLSGSWIGASYDGINSKVSECAQKYISALQGQMNSFASACDLYQEYENKKQQLATARANYNSAKSSASSSDGGTSNSKADSYRSQISSLESAINDLKGQIEGLLGAASGAQLDSSSGSSTASISVGGESTGTTGGETTNTSTGTTTSTGVVSSQLQGLTEGTYTKVNYQGQNGRSINTYIYLPKGASTTSGLSVGLTMGGDGAKAEKRGGLGAGIGKALKNGAQYSGIVVVLEAENDKSYSDKSYLETAKELTDNVVKTYNADPNKISINGYSYGGFGAVHMLEKYPNYFSQGVIIAAGSGPVGKESSSKEEAYNKLKTTKIHLICGTSDSNYSGMNDLLKNLSSGGKVTYNFIKGGTHEINYTGREVTIDGKTYANYQEFCLAQTK